MTKFRTNALLSGMLILSMPAYAVETGFSIYPKGMADFMSGFVPGQGLYVSSTYYHFDGSADRVLRNGTAEFGVGMSLDAGFLRGTYVSDLQVLGGSYGVGGALAVAGTGIDANLVGPAAATSFHAGNSGLGDSILTPVLLGWHNGNLHWNTTFSLYVPTGDYNPGTVNIGRNVWGFMPGFAMTWFDPKNGWDVSGALTYVSQTRNDATDYQSGDMLHFDWAIGKHLGGGWELGVSGTVMQQISSDSGAGAKFGPFKAQSAAIGPALNYNGKIGATPFGFTVKWQRDFSTSNTIGGNLITVAANVSL